MRKILSILVLAFCIAFFPSCRKDKLLVNSSAKLKFTTDSILFDTVFTSIGSTTQLFRVHNDNNGTVNISSIRLARGNSSFYTLNVDGTPGKSFSNIEIAAHDSIYVFVKVTIDPNADPSVSPFIYRDSILFETNGNHQDVKLVAFGQNAYYHMPTSKIVLSATQALYYSVDTNYNAPYCHTWPNDKPHLIYGYYVVDSLHTLTIPAGTKIYMHNNAGIWVYKGGCIQIKGALNNEVIIQGDRREPEYKDLPGQWDRIWINEGCANNCQKENIIDYAIIKNGFIGVHAGYSVLDGYGGNTITASDPRHLTLSNTIIQNCSFAGILARFFRITAGNNVVSNCGKYLTALQYGGSYSFTQCTFANYWAQTNNSTNGSQSRTSASFFFNNYVDASLVLQDSSVFNNCILDGNLAEEFQFDTLAGTGSSPLVINFNYDILKTQSLFANSAHTFSCIPNGPPVFKDAGNYNFHIDVVSPSAAKGTGNSLFIVSPWDFDIEGNFRGSPDLGAYKIQ
ncbi:MAG: hypothetical protein ACXVC6_05975 [Bacteroidia bacterium]